MIFYEFFRHLYALRPVELDGKIWCAQLLKRHAPQLTNNTIFSCSSLTPGTLKVKLELLTHFTLPTAGFFNVL